MKTILITIALLIGLSMQAQQAKLQSWYSDIEWFDILDSAYYVYDDEDNLKTIYLKNCQTNSIATYTYSNDTLIEIDGYTIFEYTYLGDTAIIAYQRYDGTWDSTFYTLNEYNAVIKVDEADYVWENGNVVESFLEGEEYDYRTYHTDYINPWYEENKYFRKPQYIPAYGPGSYNVMDSQYKGNGSITSLVVTESIGVFPTVMEHYSNETLHATYYLTYYDIISDIPEASIQPHTVLSVDYFDILGRKISKPSQGFYIERKTTDKGIISKKYFIQ